MRRFAAISVVVLLYSTFAVAGRPPMAIQTLTGGFWRTDNNFQSTLQLDNKLVVQDLAATPIIYFEDGTEFVLPTVIIPKSSVRAVNLNAAIDLAPPEILAHRSSFGSVSVRFTWPYVSALGACVENLDRVRSLISNYPLGPTRPELLPRADDIYSFWWRQTNEADAVIGLTNSEAHPVAVHFENSDNSGNILDTKEIILPRHGAAFLNLGLPNLDSSVHEGRIKLSYSGVKGSVIVHGSLEDVTRGFSLTLPFSPQRPRSPRHDGKPPMPPALLQVASIGLMYGTPDAMMRFPKSVSFKPFAVLGNLASTATRVDIGYVFGETATYPKKLTTLVIPPGMVQQVDLSPLQHLLPPDQKSVNLTFDYIGQPGDLLIANASSDASQNYVFQVKPEYVGETLAKEAQYWSVGAGTDTMLTLWNQKSANQSVLVTLFFDGGNYELPIHLASFSSTMLNISELISMQSPDSHDSVIPYNVHDGKLQISSPKGIDQPMSTGVSIGTFNVKTGTCGDPCQTCTGFDDYYIAPAPWAAQVSGTQQMVATAVHQNGTESNKTTSSTWSSNNVPVATVGSSTGLVSGVASGSATVSSFLDLREAYDLCEQNGGPCEPIEFLDQSAGNVCVVPSTEDTTPNGVNEKDSTINNFFQIVSDSQNDSFAGRTVTETATAPGSNSCYWPGNSVGLVQQPVPSGGTWPVVTGNGWGPDAVGTPKIAVDSIRTEGIRSGISLPCTATFYQTMKMNCSQTNSPYRNNILKSIVSGGTVQNCRDGVCQTILY